MHEVMYSSDRTDWATPAKVFDPLHERYNFTLDVCATSENNKCPRYFTPQTNGLTQSWQNERCWMNPPYGKEIGMWLRKAVDETKDKSLVVALLPARTDTRWWHTYVRPWATHIEFFKGRVKFVGAKYCAPFPSVIVVWGRNVP